MPLTRAAVVGLSVAAAALGACAVAALSFVLVGLVFVLSYGANFDHPGAAPVPEPATVLVEDESWDDDTPMRSRQQVLEIPDGSLPALLDFYGEAFPGADGWKPQDAGPGQELCLVNRSHDDYTELVEVLPYTGRRTEAGRDRYLVIRSRFEHAGEKPCGAAMPWIPAGLL